MSNNAVVAAGLGAAAGWFLGKGQAPVASDLDIEDLTSQLSVSTQENDLLRSQVQALTALKDLATANGAAATAASTALNSQIAALTNQISTLSAAGGISFPIALGSGDPSLAGWIKGRDGMLIHRVLGNIVPTGFVLGTTNEASGTPTGAAPSSTMSVSDLYQRLAPRLVTIGRNVNTHLFVDNPAFVDGNNAIVFNFEDDVADDPDFIAAAQSKGLLSVYCRVYPIGRKSLIVCPLSPISVYSTWSYQQSHDTIFNGITAGYTTLNKWSSSAAQTLRFRLSHRAARALTLRSINVVANPLLAGNETNIMYIEAATPSGSSNTAGRYTEGAARLMKIHTSVSPTFYRVGDVTKMMETVDVSSAAYL